MYYSLLAAIVIGFINALLVVLAGALSALLSTALVVLAIYQIERCKISFILGNPSVRFACVLSLPFSILGVAIGLLSGLSRTSVVGTVIPAMLTLLAASSTYFYAKGRQEALVALVAMISLSLAMVVGLSMGAALRPT